MRRLPRVRVDVRMRTTPGLGLICPHKLAAHHAAGIQCRVDIEVKPAGVLTMLVAVGPSMVAVCVNEPAPLVNVTEPAGGINGTRTPPATPDAPCECARL